MVSCAKKRCKHKDSLSFLDPGLEQFPSFAFLFRARYRDLELLYSLTGSSFMSAIAVTKLAVHLRPEDNIAVAARNLEAGLEIQHEGATFKISKRVGLGHK